MKKNTSLVVALVVVIVLAIGGYAIFHKSPKPATNSNTTSKTSTATVNNAVLTTKTDSALGNYLADPSGNPLYTDGSGSTGVSNCSASCLTAWPVYQDKGSTTGLPANVGTIKRSDNGEVQYTYNGMPLYYFSSDSPGHVTGNGVSGFKIAQPVASSSSSSSSSSSGYPY